MTNLNKVNEDILSGNATSFEVFVTSHYSMFRQQASAHTIGIRILGIYIISIGNRMVLNALI